MIDWEARLKREGLGHLDTVLGDDIGVSNRGSGTPKDQHTADHREENEAEIDRRRAILATRAFKTPTHRRIWQLHTEGFGRRTIAERLTLPVHVVRASIAATEAGSTGSTGSARANPLALAKACDTVMLMRLVLAWR